MDGAKEVEILMCLAILPEGTDATARILKRFLDYRERKEEVISQIGIKVKKEDYD